MNKMFQASTLNALMLGNYDSTISVSKMLEKGDTGIGTYEGLDGEAIFFFNYKCINTIILKIVISAIPKSPKSHTNV